MSFIPDRQLEVLISEFQISKVFHCVPSCTVIKPQAGDTKTPLQYLYWSVSIETDSLLHSLLDLNQMLTFVWLVNDQP